MSVVTRPARIVITLLALCTIVRIARVVAMAGAAGLGVPFGILWALLDLGTWSGLAIIFFNWFSKRSSGPSTARR
jgi:hypothetical protein